MEKKGFASLGLPSPDQSFGRSFTGFNGVIDHFTTLLSKADFRFPDDLSMKGEIRRARDRDIGVTISFSSISVSAEDRKWMKCTTRDSPRISSLLTNLSVFERAIIGAAAGGIAGAFTNVCLLPLDTVKTKLQTKGASQFYNSAVDAAVKTFQTKGILGFYSGLSAVIVGSTASSAVYFGTCELGKSLLSKLPKYPPALIPPVAGAMGNIMSSAIMVPKELIAQKMQAGSPGRTSEVLLRILRTEGILGLYAGYSATLMRNLPSGILSFSTFEYLKSAVLHHGNKSNLGPIESVCCGALAGAVASFLTTPLDVVKTRLMTQIGGETMMSKVSAVTYHGVSMTVKQILKDEGLIGFSRGMAPRVLQSACFSAIGYLAFETARLAILEQHLRRRRFCEESSSSSSPEI